MTAEGWRRETLAVSAGRGPRHPGAPLNVPLVASSTFHGGPELNPYARAQGTATWTAFEQVLGALEGGQAVAFASGMAAVAAVLETLPLGAKVLVPHVGYMGARNLLARTPGRYTPCPVDPGDLSALATQLPGAALVWVESPSNPLLDVVDLEALTELCRAANVPLAVDNTVATPLRQRPLELGAAISVHSVTKFLGGHSDLLMGAVVTGDDARAAELRAYRALHGAVPGALEAFLATRGVRTLPVRLARAEANAAQLATQLEAHPRVTRVRYPGGALIAFELADAESAEGVCERVGLITHATSLGGVESTIERRARYPGESPLVPAGLLRFSVGCEDPGDLWRDLSAALQG